MSSSPRSSPHAWYVISLRPRGGNESLRRAANRYNGGLLALSPWMLETIDETGSRERLQEALAATRVMFTSPAAARAAGALQPLRPQPGQAWFAVGAGTALALHQIGVDGVISPQRMDSEGLLALPELAQLQDTTLGLVTAPGGRGTLTPALQLRGARVVRADVYRRVPVTPSARALAAVRGLNTPAVLAVSSGEALQLSVDSLPADVLLQLRAMPLAAASDRLADLARSLGFPHCHRARSARPADLIEAAVAALA